MTTAAAAVAAAGTVGRGVLTWRTVLVLGSTISSRFLSLSSAAGRMRYREMSIQGISCSEEQCKDLSYSHVTVTAGGVGAQLFRCRYASVAQIRP